MWADTVFQDWDDCVWEDWEDCVWDKFEMQDRIAGTRTIRLLPAEGSGNFRRPYLEGNPSYVEDNQRYPDTATANALMKAKGEVQPHMIFKQPYRYENLQKMKYRNEPAFPHHETMSAQNLVETPMDIIDEAAKTEPEYEWRWIRYFDFSKYTSVYEGTAFSSWFDNRWIPVSLTVWSCYVLPQGTWYRDFRPLKVRVTFDGSQELSFYMEDNLLDGTYIVTEASYTSGTEITIDWAGRDMESIEFDWPASQDPVSPYATALENIEFYQQVEKGTYLGSDERLPRKQISPGLGKAAFPDPNPIRDSVRLSRRGNLRTTR